MNETHLYTNFIHVYLNCKPWVKNKLRRDNINMDGMALNESGRLEMNVSVETRAA